MTTTPVAAEKNWVKGNGSSPTLTPTRNGKEHETAGWKDLEEKNGISLESRNHTNGIRQILSRTISRTSHVDPGPPPDGGRQAWTQAFVAHIVVLGTWGYISSFGVFQTYYVDALGHTASDVSWIGAIQVFLLFFIGTVSGRATDAGLFKHVFIAGSFFEIFGLFMTSLSTKYWQLLLAQGVCTGIGNGLLFCPTLTLLATYFTKRRALAISIAASGTATGGLLFPGLVEVLLPRIGFPWTVRVLGFCMLALQLVALAFVKTRLPPRKSGPLVELSAFKELPYALFTIGMFFMFWGIYFAYYYIGSFARNIVGLSYSQSINLLLIMNGVGIPGRLVPAILADRFFGPLNTIIPVAFVTGLTLYCWAFVQSQNGLVAFAVIYGLGAAGLSTLFPAVITSITKDISKTGIRLGMVFTVVSFAVLTGPPLAGALILKDDGGYLYAQMFAGTVLMCSCLMLIAARISETGLKVVVRM
ncbi:hypothetical protein MMC09_006709 [Bachmanniomyces sp. S44760]|nr:hypothetical protein [Bachmanniomyces sp. S44760]